MKRIAIFLIPLAAFVVLALFLWRGLSLTPSEVPSPFIGKPAPAFTLTQLSDPQKNFSPKDMLGKVWLLNVWASWCEACRDEHPILVEFSRATSWSYAWPRKCSLSPRRVPAPYANPGLRSA